MMPTWANCRGRASPGDEDSSWQPIRVSNNWTPTGLEVLPAWEEYCWEGNIRDCSIEDGVQAWFPAAILFHAGRLVWEPGAREWHGPSGGDCCPVRRGQPAECPTSP